MQSRKTRSYFDRPHSSRQQTRALCLRALILSRYRRKIYMCTGSDQSSSHSGLPDVALGTSRPYRCANTKRYAKQHAKVFCVLLVRKTTAMPFIGIRPKNNRNCCALQCHDNGGIWHWSQVQLIKLFHFDVCVCKKRNELKQTKKKTLEKRLKEKAIRVCKNHCYKKKKTRFGIIIFIYLVLTQGKYIYEVYFLPAQQSVHRNTIVVQRNMQVEQPNAC